jgi:hypothetical protein
MVRTYRGVSKKYRNHTDRLDPHIPIREEHTQIIFVVVDAEMQEDRIVDIVVVVWKWKRHSFCLEETIIGRRIAAD